MILVGCVKLKQDEGTGACTRTPLWQRRWRYAQASGCRWLILSAKHEPLDPDERRPRGDHVVRRLEDRLASIAGRTFEVRAGVYTSARSSPGSCSAAAESAVPLAHAAHGVEELLIIDAQKKTVSWLGLEGSEYQHRSEGRLIELDASELAEQIDWP